MNELSGARVALDATGNRHTGTLSGGVRPGQPGRSGQPGDRAYWFDGISGVVRVANTPRLRPGSRNVVLSLWYKARGCWQKKPADCDMVKYGSSVDPGKSSVKLEVLPDGRPLCGFSGSLDHTNMAGNIKVTTGTWTFIECIKLPNRVIMKVNGRVIATDWVRIGAIYPVRDLFIGSDGNGDETSGLLDDVRIAYQVP